MGTVINIYDGDKKSTDNKVKTKKKKKKYRKSAIERNFDYSAAGKKMVGDDYSKAGKEMMG
tara:strand:+ start:400 stop:582 length:183 start_codon:yes stop_codon:yes gene_type:complete